MSRSTRTEIAMVAGEPSGDLLAASVLPTLRSLISGETHLAGIGGEAMVSQGFESYYPLEKLSVFGYLDAIRHLPELLSIRRNLKKRWFTQPPDVFVGVDAPDFNFGLAQALKNKGIPTMHFVSPSIWAWRGERIEKIKQAISHMLVLFPFEVPIYEAANIPVTFIGHPMAQTVPASFNTEAARARLGLPSDRRVIALLPGSRASELKYLAAPFLAAAEKLLEKSNDLFFVVPMANTERAEQFQQILSTFPALQSLVKVVLQQTPIVLEAADVVVVASGTASLETALYQKPMVIAYAVSPILAWFLKRKAYLPWVGLPNILLHDSFVPELIQENLHPQALCDQVWDILHDQAYQAEVQQKFGQLRQSLTLNTSSIAAQAIYAHIAQK